MKITKHSFLLILISTALFLSSCSSDDDNGNTPTNYGPQNVFTAGVPKSIEGYTLKYNADGLLEEMKDEDEKITFEYPSKTKSTNNNNIIMRITDLRYSDSWTFNLTLGSNGFIKSALQTYSDGDTDTWEFKYNNDGQLNYMKRSEGDNEVTNISYKDGNITGIVMTSDDSEEDTYETSITYTSEKHPNGIENKGCIMLFDQTFGIDMDEMKFAYYAGLLGKATKNLPLEMTDNDDDTYVFEWTLNGEGYPTKLVYDDYGYTEEIKFGW